MRIVTLNTWGGRAGREKVLSFFEKYKDLVDIFCLQEIWSAPYENLEGVSAGGLKIKHDDVMTNGLQDISKLLSEFTVQFHPHYLDNYGLAIFIRKDFDIKIAGDVFVHLKKGDKPEGDIGLHPRNIQYVTLTINGKIFNILNFHGLWNGRGKGDSEARLAQSQACINFINSLEGSVVFCGDFNLKPDTESIKMLEDNNMNNLIRDYNVFSTRTSYYTKPEKFADYMFTTKDVQVKKFKVLPDEVSDHAALLLEID